MDVSNKMALTLEVYDFKSSEEIQEGALLSQLVPFQAQNRAVNVLIHDVKNGAVRKIWAIPRSDLLSGLGAGLEASFPWEYFDYKDFKSVRCRSKLFYGILLSQQSRIARLANSLWSGLSPDNISRFACGILSHFEKVPAKVRCDFMQQVEPFLKPIESPAALIFMIRIFVEANLNKNESCVGIIQMISSLSDKQKELVLRSADIMVECFRFFKERPNCNFFEWNWSHTEEMIKGFVAGSLCSSNPMKISDYANLILKNVRRIDSLPQYLKVIELTSFFTGEDNHVSVIDHVKSLRRQTGDSCEEYCDSYRLLAQIERGRYEKAFLAAKPLFIQNETRSDRARKVYEASLAISLAPPAGSSCLLL